MVWHILGWLTVALGVVTTVATIRILYTAGRWPYSWQRPVPVPSPIDDTPLVIRGDDYIGLII